MPNFDQYKINPQRKPKTFKWRKFAKSGHTTIMPLQQKYNLSDCRTLLSTECVHTDLQTVRKSNQLALRLNSFNILFYRRLLRRTLSCRPVFGSFFDHFLDHFFDHFLVQFCSIFLWPTVLLSLAFESMFIEVKLR